MSNPPATTHLVFGTGPAYSHVPNAVNLCLRIVTLDPTVRISMLVHANNVTATEKLVAESPAAAGRFKFWPVGDVSPSKDVAKSYLDMAYKSGGVYAQTLADQTWPTPTVFIFDVSLHYLMPIKAGVEAKFSHLKPIKVVGYSPWAESELLHLAGSEENGSRRWLAAAALAHGLDTKANALTNPDELAKKFADPERLLRDSKLYEEIFICSDRLTKIPGVPPAYEYEFWSLSIDWTRSVMYHGMLEYNIKVQDLTPKIDAWVSCYPSDILQPETLEAIKTDSAITQGGVKPFFTAGCFGPSPQHALGDSVKGFLDKHEPKSVVLVSFGTVVDAGHGAGVLFAELAAAGIPFIVAGGNQLAALPEATRIVLDTAEHEGRALAPEWLDQVGVLAHPAILCFVSHCGVNSMLEALLAEVPILTWGRAIDQVANSSALAARGHGIELLQHREGCGVGRPIAHTGEILTGRPEDLQAEVKDALARVRGEEGQQIRQRLKEAAAEIRSRRDGVWDENIREFVGWTKGV